MLELAYLRAKCYLIYNFFCLFFWVLGGHDGMVKYQRTCEELEKNEDWET